MPYDHLFEFPDFRIISGGQTGADRAALDFAIENRIPHGGWCPKGRLAEDGPIDGRYNLMETKSSSYLERTELNVQEADATVIFTVKERLSGGSKRTMDFALKHGKPVLHLPRDADIDYGMVLREFLRLHQVRVLNVAGSRASTESTIGKYAIQVLYEALSEI